MERESSSGVMRLGPLALRLLARRRRWLRWAAVAVAALTILSAAAQFRHRPAPRPAAVPAGGVHGPVPASRFYGVAAEVPPGMRAVNLIVPAAATFGGRLVPASHVDVLAAFDVGQDRLVRRVLASGIVLHVTQQVAPPAGAAPPPPLSPADGRFGAAPVAELSIAVPAGREREVVMAQAFGRVFVVVEPMMIGASPAAAVHGPHERAAAIAATFDGPLSLRRYLGLPAVAPAVTTSPALIPASAGLPQLPGLLWPSVVPRAATVPASAHGSGRPPDAPHDGLTIEVIEGTGRSFAEVTP